MATTKNLKIEQGRRFSFSGTITKKTGNVTSNFPLTGYTMKLQAKANETQSTLDIDVTLTPDADQVTNPGDYTGDILPEHTKDLTIRSFNYEINIFDATGEYLYTSTEGKITLERMVNKAPS